MSASHTADAAKASDAASCLPFVASLSAEASVPLASAAVRIAPIDAAALIPKVMTSPDAIVASRDVRASSIDRWRAEYCV